MPFHEDMIFIVDLLPEPHHCFLWIHFFNVAGAPSSPTLNLIPVTSPAAWELFPVMRDDGYLLYFSPH